MEFDARQVDGFRCITPNDGFWIRIKGLLHPREPKITKGYNSAYKRYRNNAVPVLAFNRRWYTSDAQVVSCWSRSTGLTCKHYDGLSFWLGRYKGYRIYFDAPGFRPSVRPLFRTSHGLYCGINQDTLEPANPGLLCWAPRSGLELAVYHNTAGQGGGSGRREKAKGYRPPGFRMLAIGQTFTWRCRSVTAGFAEKCSTASGTAVFTCENEAARLTCKNLKGEGFWVSRTSFYAF